MADPDQPDYRQLSCEDIEAMQDGSTEMKILRAFLTSVEERCLHIPKTLIQYYYSTLADADESIQDQVVYKFAAKQHRRQTETKMQEREQHEARARDRLEGSRGERRDDRSGSRDELKDDNTASIGEQEKPAEPSWYPPKVMMVLSFLKPFTPIRMSHSSEVPIYSIIAY